MKIVKESPNEASRSDNIVFDQNCFKTIKNGRYSAMDQ